MNWHVAQCIPHRERLALRNVAAQGFQAYWPHYMCKSRVGIGKTYERSLFPGYLFVQFDTALDQWKRICSSYGIRKILGATDYGVPSLPTSFVESMIATAEDGLLPNPADAGVDYKKGDELTILDGPLAGYSGIMQYAEGGRIMLLLSLLNRKISVVCPIDKLTISGVASRGAAIVR